MMKYLYVEFLGVLDFVVVNLDTGIEVRILNL